MKGPLSIGMVRQAVQGLHAGGFNRITHQEVYECFGVAGESDGQRARVRRQMDELVKRRELERVGRGVFTYHPQHAPQRKSTVCQRIYRTIRAAQPGFSAHDIQQLTRVGIKAVRRYLGWLQEEGYLAPHGRRGNTKLWRATQKAREQRETPYIPTLPPDPFEQERNAACRLVRLFMERDLGQPATRQKIVNECQSILNRFANEEGNDDR